MSKTIWLVHDTNNNFCCKELDDYLSGKQSLEGKDDWFLTYIQPDLNETTGEIRNYEQLWDNQVDLSQPLMH